MHQPNLSEKKLKLLTRNKSLQVGSASSDALSIWSLWKGQMQRMGIFPKHQTLTWMSGRCDVTSRVSCNNWISGLSSSRGQRGFAGKVIRQCRALWTGSSWKDYSYSGFLDPDYASHRMSCQIQVADGVTDAQRCSLCHILRPIFHQFFLSF